MKLSFRIRATNAIFQPAVALWFNGSEVPPEPNAFTMLSLPLSRSVTA